MFYYVLEYYRKGTLWKWRYVFQNGKRRQVLSESTGSYKRWVDCVRSWKAVRSNNHNTVKNGGKRLV